MGFPVGYSELMLPKVLLQLVFFLGHVRRLISWIFEAMGLGDLLLDTDISIAPSTADYSPAGAAGELYRRRHGGEERSATAALIQEMLPVTLVGDLQTEGWDIPEACAVCLQEFSAGDEVRRPGNCRHIFHRCCLDRWTEHDQRTCPLCRTPLLAEDLRDALDGRIWTAAGESAPSYYEGFDFTGAGEDEPALSLLYRYSPPALVASS